VELANIEKIESLWEVNMRGYKYAAKQMIKQDNGGRIVGTGFKSW
jgi:hypothetical protein